MKKLVYFILLFYSINLFSKTSGTTSLAFLKIEPGARASGIGGAFSGYGDDATSIYYNAAIISSLKKHNVILSHIEYISDIRMENLAASFKIKPSYSFGIGASYFYMNDLVYTIRAENIEGFEEKGTFSSSDLLLVICNSFRFNSSAIGFNFKYIREAIYIEQATTFAIDFGFVSLRKYFGFLKYGISLHNLGIPVKFVDKKENLPSSIRLGLNLVYSPFHLNKSDNYEDLNFSVDLIRYFDTGFKINTGLEIWLYDFISLRAGYRMDFANKSLLSFSIGGGIRYNMFSFDYSFTPFEYFGNIHNLSLGIKF